MISVGAARLIMLTIVISFFGSMLAPQQSVHASTIPTTSNPTIDPSRGGVRTMQNVSFEEFGICPDAPTTSFHIIRMDEMEGWFTTQPKGSSYLERCNGVIQGSEEIRGIELQSGTTFGGGRGGGYTPEDGVVFAELNAYNAGMLYQPLCVRNDEEFEFSFAHRPVGNRTDIAAFRIGIPSGLDAGSVPADTYSREILQASTTQASNIVTSVSQTVGTDTTANPAVVSTNKWGVFSGTHKLPSTGYDGVRNVGFVAVAGLNAGEGNLLDDIRLGLEPIIDLGTTRDRAGAEGARPTAINIRINGRVKSGTVIVLEQNAGTATPDSDYTLGAVTAGKYGAATVTHTNGNSTWTITIPPGDYDGGMVARSRAGGLTIPVSYLTDSTNEAAEWAKFNIKGPGVGGSSSNWLFDDPTCDGSFKSDGAVYTINNVAAAATPSATFTTTPSNTASPTNTFTPTPHPFAIRDVAVGASFTLAVLHNNTLVTWGFNREGQASLPRWMNGRAVNQVEVGSNYAMALGTDGRVYGWGANDFGQMKIPTAATSGVREISASLGHVMAIKTNGDLVIWGRNDFKQIEAPLAARKGLTTVGAGHSHALAVKSGKVIAWGRNTWGQTRVPSTLTNVVAVAGGFDHSLALRSNGTVVCWGRNHQSQCKIPNGLKDVIRISAGVGYSMALTRDGKVFAWGRNDYGQARIPNGISAAGAIAAGYVNSVIGLRDANVVAFGNAMHGSLVSRTPTVTP